eukprot:2215892-Amphidinium_carterae.1
MAGELAAGWLSVSNQQYHRNIMAFQCRSSLERTPKKSGSVQSGLFISRNKMRFWALDALRQSFLKIFWERTARNRTSHMKLWFQKLISHELDYEAHQKDATNFHHVVVNKVSYDEDTKIYLR